MCDGAASHDQIVKAATKKAFTDRAVVHKVDKKPSLNSPVYFKGDRPKPEEPWPGGWPRSWNRSASLGGDAYPPTLRRLAELCEVEGPREPHPQGGGLRPHGRADDRRREERQDDDPRRTRRLHEDIDGGLARPRRACSGSR